MSVEVRALFETPDMADFALGYLHDRSIQIESYTIKPTREAGGGEVPISATAVAVAPADSMSMIGHEQFYYGAVNVGWQNNRAGHTGEVELRAMVSERDAALTRAILLSAHGLRVQ